MSPITTIAEIGKHEGQSVTIRGWLYNLAREREVVVPAVSRRLGHHSGRGAEERGPAGSIRCHQDADTGIERDCRGQGSRRQTRPWRLRTRCGERAGGAARARIFAVSHYSQGARYRLPDGAPAPVGALAAASGDSAGARGDHQGGPRLLRRTRLHPDRSADHHSGRVRGNAAHCSRSIISTSRPSSRSQASFTWKRPRWRWARCIRSVPHFARKNRRRGAISPSSGWSSPKSPTPNSTT